MQNLRENIGGGYLLAEVNAPPKKVARRPRALDRFLTNLGDTAQIEWQREVAQNRRDASVRPNRAIHETYTGRARLADVEVVVRGPPERFGPCLIK